MAARNHAGLIGYFAVNLQKEQQAPVGFMPVTLFTVSNHSSKLPVRGVNLMIVYVSFAD